MIEINKIDNLEEILKKIEDARETKILLKPETFEHAAPWGELIKALRAKGIICEFVPIRKLNARDDEDNAFVYTTSECGTYCHWDNLR